MGFGGPYNILYPASKALENQVGRIMRYHFRLGLMFSLLLIATSAWSQSIERGHFCDPGQHFAAAPIEKADLAQRAAFDIAKTEAEKPQLASIEIARPEVERPQRVTIEVVRTQIAMIDQCFTPGHVGTRFTPARESEIQRQYAKSVQDAGPNAARDGLQQVELGVEKYLYEPVGGNPPMTLFGITGQLMNKNPFPLRAVSLRCNYVDQFGAPQTIAYSFTDVLGPRSTIGPRSKIGYVDKRLGMFPTAAKTFPDCTIESIAIWKDGDEIQTIR
jgi:hypothetical protein